MTIKKVQRVSIADQVYDVLLKKIRDGEFKTGEKIPSEIELAKQLGVSRATLKIAIQKLNTMGITETRVGEGTFVTDFDFKSFFSEIIRNNIIDFNKNDINNFRILLEFDTMHLVAVNPISDKDFAELYDILSKMEEAIRSGKDDTFHSFHYKFHYKICLMSRNAFFIKLFESMDSIFFDIYKSNSEMTWKTLGKEETIAHHRKIYNALHSQNLAEILNLQDDLLSDQNIHN